jgi:hypothetical protein
MSPVPAPAEVDHGLAGDATRSTDVEINTSTGLDGETQTTHPAVDAGSRSESRTQTDPGVDPGTRADPETGIAPDDDLEWIPRWGPPRPNLDRARHLARQRNSPEGRRLWAHYAHLATRATRIRLSFGAAAARFLQAEGPRWMGYSSLRDYVRGRLGIPWATFHTYRRVGQLALDVPDIRAAALQPGGPTLSVLDVLARARPHLDPVACLPWLAGKTVQQVRAWCDARMSEHDGEPPTIIADGCAADPSSVLDPACEPPTTAADGRLANAVGLGGSPDDSILESQGACEPPTTAVADPVYHRVSFGVPASVALYLEETLDLAQSLLGHDASDDQQLAAVVAEASTEIDLTVPPAEALTRLHLPPVHVLEHPGPASAPAPSATPESSSSPALAGSPCPTPSPSPAPSPTPSPAPSPTPSPSRPPSRFGSNRRAALVLDRFLLRQVSRLRQTDLRLEDGLLHALESHAHYQCGFTDFTDFAHQVMDIAPRTTWDRIRRAHRRRAQDPIATAHAHGRITAVQADLLFRLHRLQVPYDRFEPWIHYAQTVTTRRLRQAVAWARRQIFRLDLAWRRAGSPPPTDAQLRTSNRPLDDIAADADVPNLDLARADPPATVHWTLTSETLIDLAQLMTSLQDAHWKKTCRIAPTWWTLLAVFWHARVAWAPLVEANRTDRQRQRILARDRYRCVFPDCSLRQGVEVHHIVYRGQQGEDEDDNLVVLCGFHHRLGEHEHTVRIRGKATEGADSLRWELGLDLQGRPRLVYQGERLIFDALPTTRTVPATEVTGGDRTPQRPSRP